MLGTQIKVPTKGSEIQEIAGVGPLYRRLHDTLRARISSGHYPVGLLLPTEAALCEEFNLSRYTVREALRQLTVLGLIARRQGSGSQVVSDVTPVVFTQSMRSLSELFQYALETRFDIRTVRRAAPAKALADLGGIDRAIPWLLFDGVRRDRLSDRPLAHARVLVHAEFARLEAEFRSTEGPFYGVIERHAGRKVADVAQSITAGPMAPRTAKLLGESADATAVQVLRRYLDRDAAVLLVSINDHPANQFRYEMHLRREG